MMGEVTRVCGVSPNDIRSDGVKAKNAEEMGLGLDRLLVGFFATMQHDGGCNSLGRITSTHIHRTVQMQVSVLQRGTPSSRAELDVAWYEHVTGVGPVEHR